MIYLHVVGIANGRPQFGYYSMAFDHPLRVDLKDIAIQKGIENEEKIYKNKYVSWLVTKQVGFICEAFS